MRLVFGLEPKCQRGWLGALSTYWSPGPRLYVELGATGTVWKARLGSSMKQTSSLLSVYERLHELKAHPERGGSFHLETVTAIIGDMFSAKTYDSLDFFSSPDILPTILAPANRVVAGRGFVDYGDALLQILDKLEQRLNGELAITIDMGYPLPGLTLQKLWCSSSHEITLVMSDDVCALGWLEEFVAYEQPITILIVHNDKGVRSHLGQLVDEITRVSDAQPHQIFSVPYMDDPHRYRDPRSVKKVAPELLALYEHYHPTREVLTSGEHRKSKSK